MENVPGASILASGSLEVLGGPQSVEVDELFLATVGWGGPVDMVQVVDALLHETLVRRDTAELRCDE